MIPTIENILKALASGDMDVATASRYIATHIELAERRGATPSQALPVAAGEAVALWQFRWTNPGDYPNQSEDALAWKDVIPESRLQTMESRLNELRGYQFDGKPCYEVRSLYAGSPPTAREPLSQKWINTLANQNGWDGVDGAPAWMTELVRDVESAHGIVAAPTGEG